MANQSRDVTAGNCWHAARFQTIELASLPVLAAKLCAPLPRPRDEACIENEKRTEVKHSAHFFPPAITRIARAGMSGGRRGGGSENRAPQVPRGSSRQGQSAESRTITSS